MMSAPLIAPRPVRLSATARVPFFLSNSLNAPSPVSAPAFVGPTALGYGALILKDESMTSQPSTSPQHSPKVDNGDDDGLPIEEMAARICLDDEADTVSANTGAQTDSDMTANDLSGPVTTEEIARITTRSPEAAAALDEFLSILRPVIRAPASPIARAKRLVPRSRHSHHHAGLHVATSSGPSQDRHHPYARSAKSTSPLERAEGSDIGSVLIGVGNKRPTARSPTSLVTRRSSNANESSYSCGSASMCSSRSQSVSRRGSDGFLNAWTAASPPSAVPMDTNTDIDTFNASGQGVASLLLLSGVSPHGSSPTHEFHE